MTSSTSDFAQTIRTLRLRSGLSQEELAERAGVSARAISDMERGLRKSPRPETLRLVAAALSLDDDEQARFFTSAHAHSGDTALSGQPSRAMPIEQSTAIPLAARPLPMPLDSVIGREHDIEAIVSLLESGQVRLVTLIGPGGVGKTRLSLSVASQLQSGFAEGAAFVDLAPLSDPNLVAPTISSALGLPVDPQMESRASLLTALRSRQLLLLLDNFEHLLSAAPLITELLSHCPALIILATSRVRLRLRGEHVYSVQPLSVPETPEGTVRLPVAHIADNPSVRLFVDRARESHFGFVLDDQNAVAITDICGRLDGLPLAIELAASRAGVLSPGALQVRIQNRLPALTGGARDAPARQQTLRDAIAWSYDLLDPPEQSVFRQLSVFVGGFTPSSAESVVRVPDVDVPAIIETLAECSLIARVRAESDEPRWTMLDTIHDYAAVLLEESGERPSVRRQHADWYVQLVTTAGADLLDCRNEAAWYQKLDAEIANIRAAIEFMLESGDGPGVMQLIAIPFYWSDRPYQTELLRWIECALPLSPEPPGDATLLAMSQVPLATALLGDLDAASTTADSVLDLARSNGSPLVLGWAYYMQGTVAEFSSQTDKALLNYERSLEYCRGSGHISQLLNPMFEVGGRKIQTGALEEAVEILDEGLGIARQAGAEAALPFGLIYRGLASLELDDSLQAARSFAEGLELAHRFRIDRITLGLMGAMSGVAVAIGHPELAARLQGATEAARQSSGVTRISETTMVEAIMTATREQLGAESYDALLLEGRSMSFDEAIQTAYHIAANAETFWNRSVEKPQP